jgi:triacylglycerol lipase
MTRLFRFGPSLLLSVIAAGPAFAGEPDCVVLLHGLGLRGIFMQRLESALRKDGYRVVNITYPSRKLPFEKLAGEYLPAQLKRHDVARAPHLHFVTHSLGSLLVRKLIQNARPANLGRVVMLGPPNHGSVAADRVMRNWLLRKFFGPNLPRLGTSETSIVRSLPPADFEVGIIAGNARINPLFDRALAAAHDGVVTVDSARLAGMRDFLVVPYSHTYMLWRTAVIRQTRTFLREGKFKHPEPNL